MGLGPVWSSAIDLTETQVHLDDCGSISRDFLRCFYLSLYGESDPVEPRRRVRSLTGSLFPCIA
jgi:hypothetical protein